MTNELTTNVNNQEVTFNTNLSPKAIVGIKTETEDFIIYQLADGTFKKQMKYKKLTNYVPQTEEEQKRLFSALTSEESELVTPMKSLINQEISIKAYILQPYQKFDEQTGENINGVVTMLVTDNDEFITTSSKTVYYTMLKIIDAFNFKLLKLKVTGTPMPDNKNHVKIGIDFIDYIAN